MGFFTGEIFRNAYAHLISIWNKKSSRRYGHIKYWQKNALLIKHQRTLRIRQQERELVMVNSTIKDTFSLKNMYKAWILTGKAGKMAGKSVRIKDFKEDFTCFGGKNGRYC